jgi:hypothetical protein
MSSSSSSSSSPRPTSSSGDPYFPPYARPARSSLDSVLILSSTALLLASAAVFLLASRGLAKAKGEG